MAEADTVTQNLDATISEEDLANSAKAAAKAWAIIQEDRSTGGLMKIQAYLDGDMDGPYMPSAANAEYRHLAIRSTSNWLIPALNAPAQALFLEDHHLEGQSTSSPAFRECWRRNRLAGRQSDLYRDALSYEQAYVAVQSDEREGPKKGKARVLLISRLNSVALYVDPVNDERPSFFLYVQKDPVSDKDPGHGLAWDREHLYDAVITTNSRNPVTLKNPRPHGATDCPVVPFTPYRDLTGKPRGVIRPLIPIQDRINQTIFDLMIAQSYGAFVVRYITGMVPPPKMANMPVTKAEIIARGEAPTDDPAFDALALTEIAGYKYIEQLDSSGNPIPENVTISPSNLLVVEEPTAKVGSIPATPLDGYIASIEMSVKHLAAIAQVPPQFLLGNIANLSADALASLEASLIRMVAEFQHSFGESWEQVFQICAEIEHLEGADVYNSDPIWRDMTSRSLSQTVAALGQAATMLDVPKRALWSRLPGTSATEVSTWAEMAEQDKTDLQASRRSTLGRSVSPANQGWYDNGAQVSDDG